MPARTALSDAISKDLRARGFSFVGSTIVYAYLQAAGVVDDHSATCFRAQGGTPAGGGLRLARLASLSYRQRDERDRG